MKDFEASIQQRAHWDFLVMRRMVFMVRNRRFFSVESLVRFLRGGCKFQSEYFRCRIGSHRKRGPPGVGFLW